MVSSVHWDRTHEKFVKHILEVEWRKGMPTPKPEENRQCIEDTGFVDIQVFKKWCGFGTYTHGIRIEIGHAKSLQIQSLRGQAWLGGSLMEPIGP